MVDRIKSEILDKMLRKQPVDRRVEDLADDDLSHAAPADPCAVIRDLINPVL